MKPVGTYERFSCFGSATLRRTLVDLDNKMVALEELREKAEKFDRIVKVFGSIEKLLLTAEQLQKIKEDKDAASPS